MTFAKRSVALFIVLLVFASPAIPAGSQIPEDVGVVLTGATSVVAGTNLVVTNQTINYNLQFNDDDFLFYVYNGTLPIAGANVTLYNATTLLKYSSLSTVGDGSAVFYNVPQSLYFWNVTWFLAPTLFKTGIMRSNGPEAFATVRIGNLDWMNNDDDLNATVVDIQNNPAAGLNFSIHYRTNNSIWSQVVLGTSGIAYFSDIPKGNYTWKVSVMTGTYAGTVLLQNNFVSNGTAILVHQTVGPLIPDAQYYGLEVFTYYETSLYPISGALVNVTYKNGTEFDHATTPTNGTVRFLQLPVAFMNWTVTLNATVLATFFYNLTTVSTDIRDPVIVSPGDQDFLQGTENITINWTVSDEHPQEIKLYLNGAVNKTVTWATSPYNFTYNATKFGLGHYTMRLVAKDKNNNQAEDTIVVRIYENVTPVVYGPEDLEYYFAQTGHSLRWNVTDEHMDKYVIRRNDTSVASGSLNPDSPFVIISVDGLTIGTYVYSFMANDTSGNQATDNVTVRVKRDDVAPVISYAPANVYYVRGDLSIVRNWTATDDFKSGYTITVDGFVVLDAPWVSEQISFDFSGLSEGQHWAVLTVKDLGNNIASSAVMVVVTPPLISIVALAVGSVVGAVVIIGLVVWFVKYR